MIEYKGQINLPNENFGVTEKTITVNEDVRTADIKALAREIHHQNTLIPEDVADAVLQHFCKAAVEKMSEGFAVQLTSGSDIAMRIFPDIHLKGKGNINLKLARELMPGVVTDEATMVAHAGELIDKVGVRVSVRAVAQRKFTELLEKEEYQLKRTGIVERTAAQQQSDGDSTEGGGGTTDPDQQGGGEMEP
ncbi:MAG: hypothetical protein IKN29_07895 [Bacteroidales bacterium]|nr:hypothetical protein [Bacteroidales bacterium]